MLLDVLDVTRTFVRRGRPFAAVDHVTFSVQAGELVAIVGRSGNGKSTLLNIIAGLLKPTSGQVNIDGVVVDARNDRLMSHIRNETLGFVTQSATLLANLCVLDNVVLPAKLRARVSDKNKTAVPTQADQGLAACDTPNSGDVLSAQNGQNTPGDLHKSGRRKPDLAQASELETMIERATMRQADPAEQRAMDLLARFDIADLSMCYPQELSGGELRRVAIARALMNHPKLLVLDEPTGDLDAATTQLVMQQLRGCADRGIGVLVVTHDPDALPAADAVYRIDAGQLAKIA